LHTYLLQPYFGCLAYAVVLHQFFLLALVIMEMNKPVEYGSDDEITAIGLGPKLPDSSFVSLGKDFS
jgi:hypothetical protein